MSWLSRHLWSAVSYSTFKDSQSKLVECTDIFIHPSKANSIGTLVDQH